MVLNFQSLTEKAYIIAHSDSTASPKSKNAKIRRIKKKSDGGKNTQPMNTQIKGKKEARSNAVLLFV